MLPCSGLTAYAALKKVGVVKGAQPILLIGAGGLGLMCLELIKALGGTPPVIVDINPTKREAARLAGAAATIDPDAPDAVAQIAACCNGAPQAVIDFVGAEATANLGFDALGKGGIFVIVGLFGGAAPWPLPMIALKVATIRGSYTGSLNDFSELMELARSGSIASIPTKTHPLAQAEEVLNALEQGKVMGRALLLPHEC
ncbi:Alcohol dehydrogenase (plasmid) [Sphingobium sp. AntQ-1]|nr:Alcohol dehydrogenase [Sphingobium sp. AntQ-1]